MKNVMIYVWTLIGLVILSTVVEMMSYSLFGAPAPAGFSTVSHTFSVKIFIRLYIYTYVPLIQRI
jgi:hypothetical protein